MADFDSKARRARLRLILMGTVAVAVLTTGGVLGVMTLNADNDDLKQDAKASPSTAPTSGSTPSASKEFVPANAPSIPRLKPASDAAGIGTGFEHSSLGATSAAISYWEDLDLLDDVIARKQWTAIAAKTSPGTIDQGVTEVRKVREGIGLAPSGGTPDGITFSTNVKAALTRSLDTTGDVVNVWMVFDRYATIRDKGADENPLKDEITNLVLKWEGNDWKVTTEPQYTAKVKGPRAYDPASKFAWAAGWRTVAGG
ncbi:hypothetical protein [Streptomyces candidus]|uniref:Uncharacterized protein n=1 Tax=Streptomyces candidus TaxID=67283 RepID=A0A7X0HKK3_9ACTN|nr:hypothetical protein [Streptomyces candidus]MBB6439397.1 hypothetical protein [Streptomyces candidus]GHH54901.1 hypothetical protein GCM10018773_58600 [Streptomyces candidus]